jgi:hypothetical protein
MRKVMDSSLWTQLENTRPKDQSLTVRLAFPELSDRVFAGINSNGGRHFLIKLSESEDILNDTQSRGLTVVSKTLQIRDNVQGASTAKYLDIACRENGGHDAFDLIGREIARSLALGKDSSAQSVREVLFRWRHFWGPDSKDNLSREELLGLFAEVWFLQEWLLPLKGTVEAVSAWQGPYAHRHDFEWNGISVEIKATTSVRGRIHKIHGVDQLLPPENGKLALFSLRLREEQGASNTLPRVIVSCREKLASNSEALTIFDAALSQAGYSPLHDEEYEKIRLRVVDGFLFSVKENFPRITSERFNKGVPAGVGMVEYEVNLDGFDGLIVAKTPEQGKLYLE